MVEIYAALARAGLVAVPVNFRLRPEVAYIVQHSEARAIVVQDALRTLVDGIRDELPLDPNRWSTSAPPRRRAGAAYER